MQNFNYKITIRTFTRAHRLNASPATNRGASDSVQIESFPELLQTFVFVTRATVPGINQGNGGLSESAGISRGKLLPRRHTFRSQLNNPLLSWLNSFINRFQFYSRFMFVALRDCLLKTLNFKTPSNERQIRLYLNGFCKD